MKSDLALTKEMLFDNTGYLHYDRNDVNKLIEEANLDAYYKLPTRDQESIKRQCKILMTKCHGLGFGGALEILSAVSMYLEVQ